MKTNQVKLLQTPHPWIRLFTTIRRPAWIAGLNWYQVAVVAATTFAISMDLMFPPLRIASGSGEFYAGHAYMPVLAMGAAKVDFMRLATELLVIVAAAVVGWRLGSHENGSRDFPQAKEDPTLSGSRLL